MSDPLSYLDALLRARLTFAEGRTLQGPKTLAIREGITPVSRLVLFRSGRVRYTLEGHTHEIGPSTMLLVPALARRAWEAVTATRVVFFSFKFDPDPPWPGVLMLRGAQAAKLESAMLDLVTLSADPSRAGTLACEAAAKAIFARFVIAAQPIDGAKPKGVPDRSISGALQWLGQNLALRDPLDALHERAGVSEAELRRRFRALLGQSPRDYLLSLRMHQARFYLSETTLPVKQVARRVGFEDPLYFSRRYHQFWQRWPTDERHGE